MNIAPEILKSVKDNPQDINPIRYVEEFNIPIERDNIEEIGNSFIFFRKDALSSETCTEVMRLIESSNALQQSITHGRVNERCRYNNYSMMNPGEIDIDAWNSVNKTLWAAQQSFVADLFAPMGVLRYWKDDGFKFHRTTINGFFSWHHDAAPSLTGVPRLFTVLFYLNDDFEGGHTDFLYQQVSVKPERGMVIAYPCNTSHIHRGAIVQKGTKYIATSWLSESMRG